MFQRGSTDSSTSVGPVNANRASDVNDLWTLAGGEQLAGARRARKRTFSRALKNGSRVHHWGTRSKRNYIAKTVTHRVRLNPLAMFPYSPSDRQPVRNRHHPKPGVP